MVMAMVMVGVLVSLRVDSFSGVGCRSLGCSVPDLVPWVHATTMWPIPIWASLERTSSCVLGM